MIHPLPGWSAYFPVHHSAIQRHGASTCRDKESSFHEKKRFLPSQPQFSKSNDEEPSVISTLLQGRFSPRGRDQGETRERRGRDDRANASSSANYRLRSARFPVVATNFTNERSSPPRFSPVLLRFPSIGRRKEKEGAWRGTKSVKEHSRMDRKEKK